MVSECVQPGSALASLPSFAEGGLAPVTGFEPAMLRETLFKYLEVGAGCACNCIWLLCRPSLSLTCAAEALFKYLEVGAPSFQCCLLFFSPFIFAPLFK